MEKLATERPSVLFEPDGRATPEARRWAHLVQQEVARAGGGPEERLRAKCQWEHMSRMAVVLDWGDPRGWD